MAGIPLVRTFRDLLMLSPQRELVIACDSVGGIGPMKHDSYRVEGSDSAHFAARVALLEVLCAGARPIALIDTLCQDKVSAAPMIEEFRRIATDAGIDPEAVTGSTEDNVETNTTGIGVVVIGELEHQLLSGGAQDGDVVICIGWPRSAPHTRLFRGHPDVVPIAAVRALLDSGLLHDALPVGSRGLDWEVPQMAESANLDVRWIPDQPIPRDSSGGPSTCVLVACAPDDEEALRALVDGSIPWTRIATLDAR